jgi:hypothetical protein
MTSTDGSKRSLETTKIERRKSERERTGRISSVNGEQQAQTIEES